MKDWFRLNVKFKSQAQKDALLRQAGVSGLSASEVVRRALAFYYQWHSPTGRRLSEMDLRERPEDVAEAYQFDPAAGKWEFIGLPSEDDILRQTLEEGAKKK